MTVARQLVLSIVKETIAMKRQRGIEPSFALRTEILFAVSDALDSLVSEGALSFREASVNRYPAYELPPAPPQQQK